jgi:hypothetical protein
MIITLNKSEIFTLLQSEKFIISQILYAKTKSIIEKKSNHSLKDFSEKRLKQFFSVFNTLRFKWKHLKGGPQRSRFHENNLKEHISLKIENDEFQSDMLQITSEMTIETSEFINTNFAESKDETKVKAFEKRWKSGKQLEKKREIQKIRKSLLLLNTQLSKETGYCFKNVELCNSNLYKYNGAFLGYKNR